MSVPRKVESQKSKVIQNPTAPRFHGGVATAGTQSKSSATNPKISLSERYCLPTYQLRTFLEYKGIKEGIEVLAINPAYRSKTCNCCLHLGLRSNKSFKCTNSRCGWIGDADENGSKMIAHTGLSVNQPGGSELLSCGINSRATESSHLINEPQVS